MKSIMITTAALLSLAGCSLEGNEGVEAEVMCEEFVKDRLKAPGSADFSGQSHEESGTGGWVVTGVVDSENAFGAKLRARFRCELRNTGGDEWTASLVDVTPQ